MIADLKCEYLTNPVGLTERRPRLGWKTESDRRGWRQSAWRVLVASSPEQLAAGTGDLWDSGKTPGPESLHIEYGGSELASRQRCWWKVRVWDAAGEESEWSAPAYWEMGLLNSSEWTAEWIGVPADAMEAQDPDDPCLMPSPLMRREFPVSGKIAEARLYVTARGLYRVNINGQRIHDTELVPGWTDYEERIRFQTYDVTDTLTDGENCIAAFPGTGWYAGHVAWWNQLHGDTPQLLAQLEVTLENGETMTLGTDGQWQWREGPVRYSDLLMGERYDAQLEVPGWDMPGTAGAEWKPVTVFGPTGDDPVLESGAVCCVARIREFGVETVTEPTPGVYVCDLGQNMVGWVRLKVTGAAGREIRLRFAEVLNPDGTVYTENLRKARATDVYICRGNTEGETWEPSFTFHGFRYVEISGLEAPPSKDVVTGVVVHSAMEKTGSFECSSEKLNQLQHNIEWGQRGNYLEVPTDCPQRDERLGWMGDAQVFAATGCFNFNIAPFMGQWLTEVASYQREDGLFPDYVPFSPWHNEKKEDKKRTQLGTCSPAWRDAGVIVPWTIYERYGDRRVLERSYASIVRFVDGLEAEAVEGIGPDYGYGDWLNDYAFTPLDLISTAYNIYSIDLAARIAGVLERDADVERFRGLATGWRKAFNDRFVTPDGRIVGDTQTAYALALRFDLLPEPLRAKALDRLVYDIGHGRSARWPYQPRKGHISSGFVGVNQVMPCLSEAGQLKLAYKLLLNEDYPSWLFQVNHGATTIWERWDGFHPDRGFQNPAMNSFNHYAYGAIGQWLYETVVGLAPAEPGYRVIQVSPKPDPDRRITSAKASLETGYGAVSAGWQIMDEEITLDVVVPPNTEAIVTVPSSAPDQITESGESLPEPGGWLLERNGNVLRTGSGVYAFRAPV